MPSIEVSQCVCLLTLLWSLVEVHSETSTSYISFRGQNLSNNSYVEFNQVGDEVDRSDSVRCRTELVMCCSRAEGDLRGDWFFPNGKRLQFSGPTNDPFEGRGAQTIDLRRTTALTPSGIYRCDIASEPSAKQTFYVGIYNNGGIYSRTHLHIYILHHIDTGDVRIPGEVTFDSVEMTLTCISTGGPATTVTWTRDSITVTEGNETVLDDPVTAQYTHTLTVTTGGEYTCTVSNNKPSSDSATITVPGIVNVHIYRNERNEICANCIFQTRLN